MEQQGKWTYWYIYKQYGLNGSFLNMVRWHPLSFVMGVLSLMISTVSMVATQKLTIALSLEDVRAWYILLMACVLLSHDAMSLMTIICKKYIQQYKNNLFGRVVAGIYAHVQTAPMDVHKKYSSSDIYDAMNRFLWVYDRTTQLIITTIIGVAKSIVISILVIEKNRALIPVIMLSYYILLRHIIPSLYKDKRNESSSNLWERSHFAVADDKNYTYNPIVTDKQDSKKVANSFMDVFVYFGNRDMKWDIAHSSLSIFQNITVFIILVVLWANKSYAMIIVVLLNKDSFFSVATAYSDMINTGKHSERSLEKIIGILNAIDKAKLELCDIKSDNVGVIEAVCAIGTGNTIIGTIGVFDPFNKVNTFVDASNEHKKKIKRIEFYDMTIPLCGEKTKVQSRSIKLMHGSIEFDKRNVILLVGKTGSGKSVTLDTLTGLYDDRRFNKMIVTYANGTNCACEFNALRCSRVTIRQNVTDEYMHHGSLKVTLRELFPFDNITDIRSMLTKHFCLDERIVPHDPDEQLSATLSGGERQRFMIAAKIKEALRSKPDYIVLDEIDRAIDPSTGLAIIEWIIESFDCPIILVSHLTEIKLMLLKKGLISNVWMYTENHENSSIINIDIRLPSPDLVMISMDDKKKA